MLQRLLTTCLPQVACAILFALSFTLSKTSVAQVNIVHLNTAIELTPCDNPVYQFRVDLTGPASPYTGDDLTIDFTFPLPSSGNYLVASTNNPTVTGANIQSYNPIFAPGQAQLVLDGVTASSIFIDLEVETQCELYLWDEDNATPLLPDPPLSITADLTYNDASGPTYTDQLMPTAAVDFPVLDLIADPSHAIIDAFPGVVLNRDFSYENTSLTPFTGRLRFVDRVAAPNVEHTALYFLNACGTLLETPTSAPQTNCGASTSAAFNIVSVTPTNDAFAGGNVELEVVVDILTPIQTGGSFTITEDLMLNSCMAQTQPDSGISEQVVYYGCPLPTTCTDDEAQVSSHQASVMMEIAPGMWVDYIKDLTDHSCPGDPNGPGSRAILYTLRPNRGHADVLEIWIRSDRAASISDLDLSSITLTPFNAPITGVNETMYNTDSPPVTDPTDQVATPYIASGINFFDVGQFRTHVFKVTTTNGELFDPGDQYLLQFNFTTECIAPDNSDDFFNNADEINVADITGGGRWYRSGCRESVSRDYGPDNPPVADPINNNGSWLNAYDPNWLVNPPDFPYGHTSRLNDHSDDKNHPTTPPIRQPGTVMKLVQGFINGPASINITNATPPPVQYSIPSSNRPIETFPTNKVDLLVNPLDYSLVIELVFNAGFDYDYTNLPTPQLVAQGTLSNPAHQTIDAFTTCDVSTAADMAASRERYRISFPIESWMVDNITSPNGWQNTHGAQWTWTADANLFFAGFDIEFSVFPDCAEAGVGGEDVSISQRSFLYNEACNGPITTGPSSDICFNTACYIPLDEASTTVQILCPGCIFPGWNINVFNAYRTNIGLEDANDDNFPDAVPSTAANPSDDHLVIHDDVRLEFDALFSDGGSNSMDAFGNPIVGYTLSQIQSPPYNLFLEYGRLVIQGDLMANMNFTGGIGTYTRGTQVLNLTIPSNAGYIDNDGKFVLEFDIADINAYASNGPLSSNTVEVLDALHLELDFKVANNLCTNGFYETQDLNAWIYSAPSAFGFDALEDPDITFDKPYVADIDLAEFGNPPPTPINLPNGQQVMHEDVHFWCTGLNARVRTYCVDAFQFYTALNHSGRLGVTGINPCFKTIRFNAGGAIGQSANNGLDIDDTDQNAMQAFQNEIRNFWMLDELDVPIPNGYTVDHVNIWLQTQQDDGNNISTVFDCSFNTLSPVPYNFTNYSMVGNSIVLDIDGERTIAENTAPGPNGASCAHPFFLTHDETKTYLVEVILRFDCQNTALQTPVTPGDVTATWSNHLLSPDPSLPYVVTQANSNQISTPNHTMTGTYTNFDNTDPNIDIQFDMSLVMSNLSQNNMGATHGFLYFTYTDGTPVNMTTANIIWKRTNSTSVFNVLDSNSDGVFELGAVGAVISSSFNGKSTGNGTWDDLCIQIADFSCIGDPFEDIVVHFGYNCYNYPNSTQILTNDVCYTNSMIVDVPDQSADLTATPNTIPTTWVPCNNQIVIDINGTGLTQIDNILAQFSTLPAGIGIGTTGTLDQVDPGNGNAVVNTAPVTISAGLNGPEFNISGAGSWMDDFNGSSLPLQLTFDVIVECNYDGSPITLDIVAVDYCGADLSQSIVIQPSSVDYSSITDDLFIDNLNPGAAIVCTGNNTTLSVTIDDMTAGNIGDGQIEITLPAGFEFNSGLNMETLTFDATSVSYPNTWNFTVNNVSATGGPFNIIVDLYHISTLDCDPLVPGDCQHTQLLDQQTIQIQPGGFTFTIKESDPGCFNENPCTGSIEILAPSGGTPPFQSSVVPQGNPPTYAPITLYNNLCAGAYDIYVIDANGCVAMLTQTLVSPPQIVLSCSGTDEICGADGSATVNASGGTPFATGPPYLYQWDDPLSQTTAAATGLQAGTYTVTVTDANGCEETCVVVVGGPTNLLSVTATGTNIDCNGAANGSATASVSSGTGPYTYSWELVPSIPAGNTQTINSLAPGTYIVTVNDDNGCTAQASVTIAEPTAITLLCLSSTTSCPGASDGQGVVTASGGTVAVDYTYDWGVYGNTQTVTGLPAGSYPVIVTDDNGCTETCTVIVSDPTPITGSVNVVQPTACGGLDGSITITAFGGTPSLQYSIDNGANYQSSNIFTGLGDGTYDVLVMDANGCVVNLGSYVMTSPPGPILSSGPSTMDPLCKGQANGVIEVVTTTGTPNITFELYDCSNNLLNTIVNTGPNAIFTNLTQGCYEIIATDANNCTDQIQINLVDPTQLNITSLTPTDPTTCSGTDGEIVANVTGGTPNYMYSINGGPLQSSNTFTGLGAGTYTILVEDMNGCQMTQMITLTDPPLPTVTLSGPTFLCSNAGDIVLTCSPAPNVALNPVLSGLGTNMTATQCVFNPQGLGGQTVTITYSETDQNGCTGTASIMITIEEGFELSIDPLPILCEYDAPLDLSAYLNPPHTGGVWTVGSTQLPGSMLDPSLFAGQSPLVSYDPQSPCINVATSSITINDAFWHQTSSNSMGDGVFPEGAKDITTDSEGNVYVVGDYTNETTFDDQRYPAYILSSGQQKGSNIFVAKYNPCGRLLWIANTTNGEITGEGIVVDEDKGAVYVTGNIFGGTTFGPAQSNFFTCSNPISISTPGTLGAYIARYDMAEGCFEYVHETTALSGGESYSIDTYEETVYITGRADLNLGPNDEYVVWVQKLAESGSTLSTVWDQYFGVNTAKLTNIGRDIVFNPIGNLIWITGDYSRELISSPSLTFAAGEFTPDAGKKTDAFVLAFQDNGSAPGGILVQRGLLAHGNIKQGEAHGESITLDANGIAYFTGAYKKTKENQNPFKFGPPTLYGSQMGFRAYAASFDLNNPSANFCEEIWAGTNLTGKNKGNAYGTGVTCFVDEVFFTGWYDSNIINFDYGSVPSKPYLGLKGEKRVYLSSFNVGSSDWSNVTAYQAAQTRDEHCPTGVARSKTGHVFVAGRYRGTMDFFSDASQSGAIVSTHIPQIGMQTYDNAFVIRADVNTGQFKLEDSSDDVIYPKEAEPEVYIYPNPNQGLFSVNLLELESSTSIQILDMMGKVVYDRQSITPQLLEVDISDKQPGVYLIRIENEGKLFVRRVILQ